MNIVILSRSLVLSLVLLLMTGIGLLQARVDATQTRRSYRDDLSLLPRGELIKSVSLGYSSAVSDFLWLEVVQAIGERQPDSAGYRWIYEATDVVTTLDPRFEYSYQVAGIALASLGGEYDLSNRILKKGTENLPSDWRLPFYLGFNYFFYLNDYQNAALYISRAAMLPGHPAYLPGFAARLSIEANNPDFALEFLNRIYHDAKDENTRKELETRMREIVVEKDVFSLNRSIAEYELKTQKKLTRLTELVDAGLLARIPDEPFGGTYYFAKGKGAQSSTHPNRLRIYRNRR